MNGILTYLHNIWRYIVDHRWSKDILRANIFYIVLVVIYDLVHFSLQPIKWRTFILFFCLLNLCLFFKLVLDIIDRVMRR